MYLHLLTSCFVGTVWGELKRSKNFNQGFFKVWLELLVDYFEIIWNWFSGHLNLRHLAQSTWWQKTIPTSQIDKQFGNSAWKPLIPELPNATTSCCSLDSKQMGSESKIRGGWFAGAQWQQKQSGVFRLWFETFFSFSPRTLGKIPILTIFFQLGWKHPVWPQVVSWFSRDICCIKKLEKKMHFCYSFVSPKSSDRTWWPVVAGLRIQQEHDLRITGAKIFWRREFLRDVIQNHGLMSFVLPSLKLTVPLWK